jgi:hypothetical protein
MRDDATTLSLNTAPSPPAPPQTLRNGTPVYQKYNVLLHGAAREEMEEDGVMLTAETGKNAILNLEFLRKFIFYAKTRIVPPTLTDSAREAIVEAYVGFRERSVEGKLITTRSLETIIRLATAHAKSRLSADVTRRDVRVATDILRYSIYGEKQATRKGAEGAAAAAGEEDRGRDAIELPVGEEPSVVAARTKASAASAVKPAVSPVAKGGVWEGSPGGGDDRVDDTFVPKALKRARAEEAAASAASPEEVDDAPGVELVAWKLAGRGVVDIDEESPLFVDFVAALVEYFDMTGVPSANLKSLYEGVRARLSGELRRVSRNMLWFKSALVKLIETDKIMEAHGMFFKI